MTGLARYLLDGAGYGQAGMSGMSQLPRKAIAGPTADCRPRNSLGTSSNQPHFGFEMAVDLAEKIELGAWAKVDGLLPGVETVFHIVPDAQVDYGRHKVSLSDVWGRALLGAEVGDDVSVNIQGERLTLRILELGRV